ncbi:uncharacterized protein [Lepisosteus oculatus]|uniref:uncharacterized protein n=1 Tax=Lepisosteus oculatus TaxID=7918 RepID=UPI003711107E
MASETLQGFFTAEVPHARLAVHRSEHRPAERPWHRQLPPYLATGGYPPPPAQHPVLYLQGLPQGAEGLDGLWVRGELLSRRPHSCCPPAEHRPHVRISCLTLRQVWQAHPQRPLLGHGRGSRLRHGADSLLTLLPPGAVVAVRGLAGAPRDSVGIEMARLRTVHDSEVVLLQDLYPSCHLPLRLLKVEQPGEGHMVGPQPEPGPEQVRPEVVDRRHHRQQLATGHAVVLFSPSQSPTIVSHYALPIWPLLRQHCTHARVTRVGIENIR